MAAPAVLTHLKTGNRRLSMGAGLLGGITRHYWGKEFNKRMTKNKYDIINEYLKQKIK